MGGDVRDRARAEESEYRDLIRSMCEERIFLAAEELEHYDAARTVRVRAGSLTVSDGPAVKADEFLTGYFVIEVESLETAIDWAARVPNPRTGSVEVRPVMDIGGSTARSDQVEARLSRLGQRSRTA